MFTLLVIALILLVLGLVTTAKFLLIVALVVGVLALLGGAGPYGWGWGYRRYR